MKKLDYSKIRDVKSLEKYKNLISAQELSSLLSKGGLTAHFQPILDVKLIQFMVMKLLQEV